MLRAAQLLLRETKSVIGPETTSPAGLIFSGFSTASNFQRLAGKVAIITGAASGIAIPAAAVYSISKATLIAIVRSTAEPLARHGLRVNAISPGFTRTPMLLQEIPRVTELSPGLSEEVKRTVETKDGKDAVAVLDPEEIARAAVYLASDEARYVNGHNLVVDAGYSVQKGAENSPSPAR